MVTKTRNEVKKMSMKNLKQVFKFEETAIEDLNGEFDEIVKEIKLNNIPYVLEKIKIAKKVFNDTMDSFSKRMKNEEQRQIFKEELKN